MLKLCCSFVSAFLALTSADELKVSVYEGPTTCDDGEKVKSGDQLSMHYTGTIDQSSAAGEKGKKFDSSRDRGATFDFEIGAGRVIQGWDEGLVGLCKGAKATLIIPPALGYGDRGAGADIPGGATLRFDVEVVHIVAAAHGHDHADDDHPHNPDGSHPGDPLPTGGKGGGAHDHDEPHPWEWGGVFATDPDEASHTLILYAVDGVYGANDETMKIVVLPDDRTTTAEAALHNAEADATQSWDEACTEVAPGGCEGA